MEICQVNNKIDSYDNYDPEHREVCFLLNTIKQLN